MRCGWWRLWITGRRPAYYVYNDDQNRAPDGADHPLSRARRMRIETVAVWEKT